MSSEAFDTVITYILHELHAYSVDNSDTFSHMSQLVIAYWETNNVIIKTKEFYSH